MRVLFFPRRRLAKPVKVSTSPLVSLFLLTLAFAAPLPSPPSRTLSHSTLVGHWRGLWNFHPCHITFRAGGTYVLAFDPPEDDTRQGEWWVTHNELWMREYMDQGPNVPYTRAVFHFKGTLDSLATTPLKHDDTPYPVRMSLRK